MKQKTKFVYFLMCFCILSAIVNTTYAQGPGFYDDTNDTVPIDGGISLIIAAGVGYGAKKLKERKQDIKKSKA